MHLPVTRCALGARSATVDALNADRKVLYDGIQVDVRHVLYNWHLAFHSSGTMAIPAVGGNPRQSVWLARTRSVSSADTELPLPSDGSGYPSLAVGRQSSAPASRCGETLGRSCPVGHWSKSGLACFGVCLIRKRGNRTTGSCQGARVLDGFQMAQAETAFELFHSLASPC